MAGRLLALNFATEAHKGQTRRHGGGSYIAHPVRVARAVAHLPEPVVMAALLHDVLEDCPVTYADLDAAFGSEVADIVRELTGDHAEQLLAAPRYSPAACAIKTADKTDNILDFMRGPEGFAKTHRYAEHAYRVWSLMAHRDRRTDEAFLAVLRRLGVRFPIDA